MVRTLVLALSVAWVALLSGVGGPSGHGHGHGLGAHHNCCEPVFRTPLGDFCSVGPRPFA